MKVIQRLNDRQYVILGTCRDSRMVKKPGQEIAVLLPQADVQRDRAKRRFARFRCAELRTEDGEIEIVVLHNPAGPGFALLPDWRIADRVSIESYRSEAPPPAPAPTLLGGLRRRVARMAGAIAIERAATA